jgi:hypothetical protein
MYIRETVSKRKKGPPVKYVELVDNKWCPEKRIPETTVICNFGKEHELNEKEIRNIAYKLLSYLGERSEYAPDLKIGESRIWGVLYILENLWKKLKLDVFFKTELKNHKYEDSIHRAIVGMILNRLQEPDSPQDCYNWLKDKTYFNLDREFTLYHLYRALDFLEKHKELVEDYLYLNTGREESKRAFFYTPCVNFQIRDMDEENFLLYGCSNSYKIHNKPVLAGIATDYRGLPVTYEIFPEDRLDLSVVEKVFNRVKDFELNDFIFVLPPSLLSEKQLTDLKSMNIDYIMTGKLRLLGEDLLSVKKEFKKIDGNLSADITFQGHRYVLWLDPEDVRSDRHIREKWISRIKLLLSAINSGDKSSDIITEHPIMSKLCCRDERGFLILDEAMVKKEEKYDGLYFARTSSTILTSDEIVQSYRDLRSIYNTFKHVKTFVHLSSFYEVSEIRMNGHILLCLMSYFFQRYIEIKSGSSWHNIRTVFERVYAVTLNINDRDFIHRSELSPVMNELLRSLNLKYPDKMLHLKK